MPTLIQIMFLFWLELETASTAACTVVKLQHPFRSTQSIEVVSVSGGGKLGGKSSQIDTFFPPSGFFLWWWWWWWCLLINLSEIKDEIMGDEKVVKQTSIKYLREIICGLLFGVLLMKCLDTKIAKMATRKVKDMLLRFIFLSFFVFAVSDERGREEKRKKRYLNERKCEHKHALEGKGFDGMSCKSPCPCISLRQIIFFFSNLPNLKLVMLKFLFPPPPFSSFGDFVILGH